MPYPTFGILPSGSPPRATREGDFSFSEETPRLQTGRILGFKSCLQHIPSKPRRPPVLQVGVTCGRIDARAHRPIPVPMTRSPPFAFRLSSPHRTRIQETDIANLDEVRGRAVFSDPPKVKISR
jgi:hypothetical protein